MGSGPRLALLVMLGPAIARAAIHGIRVPLEVNIGLMGFAGDGASGLELDAAELHRLLTQLLPRRQPLCGSDSTPADVTYEFTYNVVQLKTGLPALTKALAAAMRPAAASPPGHFEVPMGDIEPHLERIHASYFEHAPASGTTAGPAAYSILVLNPQRAALQSVLPASARRAAGFPDEAISAFGYHYTDGAGASVVEAGAAGVPTQLWLSSGRFLVLDLAANPCAYGATDASEGALTVGAVPQVTTSAHSQLIGRLAALLTGAARQVLAPDLRTCTLPDFATELRVPLIALRNHNLFDPLKPGHDLSLDLARLEAQLERLLFPSPEEMTQHGCKYEGGVKKPGVLQSSLSCPPTDEVAGVDATAEITFTQTSYEGLGQIVAKDKAGTTIKGSSTLSGKRIGDCPS